MSYYHSCPHGNCTSRYNYNYQPHTYLSCNPCHIQRPCDMNNYQFKKNEKTDLFLKGCHESNNLTDLILWTIYFQDKYGKSNIELDKSKQISEKSIIGQVETKNHPQPAKETNTPIKDESPNHVQKTSNPYILFNGLHGPPNPHNYKMYTPQAKQKQSSTMYRQPAKRIPLPPQPKSKNTPQLPKQKISAKQSKPYITPIAGKKCSLCYS